MPEVCTRSVVTWRRLSLAVATSAALVAAASPAAAAPATANLGTFTLSVNGAPASLPVGAIVTYTVKLQNTGGASGEVHLKDSFPRAEFQSAVVHSTVQPDGSLTCTPTTDEEIDCLLGNLAPTEKINVKVAVAPTEDAADDTITNTATVEENGVEKKTASDDTAVTSASADLAVTDITVEDQRVGTTTPPFDVVVENNGPDVARQVEFTLAVPDPKTFKLGKLPPPKGCTNIKDGGARCKLGNVASGAKVKTTFTAGVNIDPAATVGNVEYKATVKSNTPDPDNTNNTDSESVKVT